MKLYVRVIVFLILLIGECGVVAPPLISAKDTLSVFLGIGSVLVIVPVLFIIGKDIWKGIKEKIV